MNNENFCTWTDANAFMRACLDLPTSREVEAALTTAQRLESPLEMVMLAALTAVDEYIAFGSQEADEILIGMLQSKHMVLESQSAVPIGTYRADLVMRASLDHPEQYFAPVVIECDGFVSALEGRDHWRERRVDEHAAYRGVP